MEIPKTYAATEIEHKWYPLWEQQGYFVAQAKSDKPSFCIAIPPPNVTGYLHMGHALQHTLMDMLTRWRRMHGDNALWLPGTDHAGISTQIVVERQLAKENLTRHQLGREEFERRVWAWKEHAGGTIQRQIRREGASCDWTRERFTLDEGLSQAVREVFVRLYEEGLIYRGAYIVNWCPKDETALSDLEAPKEEVKGKLYHIAYPIKDSNEHVVVATTRPETMLGDTAVAVHPEDQRYRAFHTKRAILPIVGRELPFITDEIVEMDFGTGAVKVTPAHDPNDFKMGLKHKLSQVVVIDKKGRMTAAAGAEFAGLDRFEARKRVVEKLEQQGLLLKVEDYTHKVGHCQRCHTIIEPLISTQWFAIVKQMAEAAIAAVRDGRTRFVPENWAKIYFDWLENIQDWCISRQLWWGHRIPAWYCPEDHITVSRDTPAACTTCGSVEIRQDEDVLDTWFSSALWPFSTLGWPQQTEDLKTFYPTTVMITGFDIIFFWVARMMMLGLKFIKDVPFHYVFITGLVRVEGEKMAKMKGNVIDPLDVFDRYGTDAVRFTLASAVTGGADVDLQMIKRKGPDGSEVREYPKMEAARNFANKIWNASRFVLMNLAETRYNAAAFEAASLPRYDRWILSKLNRAILEVNLALEQFRFYDATQTLYHFFWDDFCDWYIELSKPLVTAKTVTPAVTAARERIMYVLEKSLRLLHPVMPFITEELWQRLPHQGETIALAAFPLTDMACIDDTVEAQMRTIIALITKIRNVRSEMNLPVLELLIVRLGIKDENLQRLVSESQDAIQQLARVKELSVSAELPKIKSAARAVITGIEIAIPLEGLIDLEKERERLKKELSKIEAELEKLNERLSNPNFVERAQPEVVEQARLRLTDLTTQRITIGQTLEGL
ncbi:MAG: valine--tRNA ligase [Acidobacteriota bacterium]